MEIVVRYHNSVRPALEQLRDSLGTDVEQRAQRYVRLLTAIEERFVRHGGAPPATATPWTYWLAFSDDLVIQYFVREAPPAPRGWWDVGRRLARWRRGVVRIVTIIGLIGMPAAPTSALPPDSSNLRE